MDLGVDEGGVESLERNVGIVGNEVLDRIAGKQPAVECADGEARSLMTGRPPCTPWTISIHVGSLERADFEAVGRAVCSELAPS